MTNLFVVFLTGLTTGGLSCLAVQGGLLASSVAHQTEQNLQKHVVAKSASRPVAKKQLAAQRAHRHQAAAARQSLVQAISLFLGAKLAVYTVLGFFLGWLGAVLQLTPFMQAITQLTVGVFMLGTGLRMLNVHPIFRYFVIEPPSFVTRYIRKQSKAENAVAPLFLGVLTVLIPCGVTQVMMATAVGTGDPLLGAGIMFAFTLGASPVFFGLAYLATRLGQHLEARFLQVTAVVVFLLGLLSINGGLNLMGSPYSFTRLKASLVHALAAPAEAQVQPVPNPVPPLAQPTLPPTEAAVAPAPAQPGGQWVLTLPTATGQPELPAPVEATPAPAKGFLTLNALDYGYEPTLLAAPAGQPIQLKVVTNNTWGCTRALLIPDLNIQAILPDTGETVIDIPPQTAGTVLFFTCGMGMFYGQIQF